MTQTLLHVLRSLGRHPGFTVAAVLTLALGLGATTLVFGVVDGILLRPLPYPDAGRLVRVFHVAPALGLVDDLGLSDATYFRLRQAGVFEDVALYRSGAVNLDGGGPPERISTGWISHSLGGVLGVAPLLGRPFLSADERPGAPPAVLVGEGLWRRRFGARPGLVGETVRIDGVSREVVGILPASFRFPDPETEIWLPLELDPAATTLGRLGIDAVGRLPPGLTVADAQVLADGSLTPLAELFPVEQGSRMLAEAGFATRVVELREHLTGDLGASLWVVMASVGLFLLLAGANVANLFLVRAAGREREMAVRTALGAGTSQVLPLFALEGVVLGVGGAVGGGVLAMLGTEALVRFGPRSLPRLHELGGDARMLAFLAGASVATGLAIGLLPLLRYGRRWLGSALREGGRSSTQGPAGRRVQDVLVVVQVAVAMVLLLASGLTLRSVWNLVRVDPGFAPDGVLTFQVSLPPEEYPGEETAASFVQRALDTLAALPGVESVGAGGAMPLAETQMDAAGVSIEDHPDPRDAPAKIHFDTKVSAGYFETLGIPLLAGRAFTRADHERRTGAVVVNEAFARRYWPDESALSKRLQPRSGDPDPDHWYTIVGVVADVRTLRLEEPAPEVLYYPLVSLPGDRDRFEVRSIRFALRTGGDPDDLVPAIRRRIGEMDPHLPVTAVQTMYQVVTRAMSRWAFVTAMLGIGGLGALLVGAVGIYGVVSYLVEGRVREIGIRMALGATRGDVVGMVVRRSVLVSAVGMACGLAAAATFGRGLGAVLYGIGPYDPWTAGAVVLLLGAVVWLASLLPARRAGSVDPADVLAVE